VQGFFHDRVAAPEGVDPESGQKVEVPLPITVVEVTAFAPYVKAVEAEGLQHLYELGVEILTVQAEVLALAGLHQRADIFILLNDCDLSKA
jgi:hypothetical protein